MNKYEISSCDGFVVFGIYEGKDRSEAVHAFCVESGFTSLADAAATYDQTVGEFLADIAVSTVREN